MNYSIIIIIIIIIIITITIIILTFELFVSVYLIGVYSVLCSYPSDNLGHIKAYRA